MIPEVLDKFTGKNKVKTDDDIDEAIDKVSE